jgi:cephalosporin hydroxylase
MNFIRFPKLLHLPLFDLIVIVAIAAVAGASATSIGYQTTAKKTDERFLAEYYQKTEQALILGTRWLGSVIEKYPNDLYSYQELIWETKPDVLVEMGTIQRRECLLFCFLV